MSAILDEINKSAYQYCESIQNKLHQICAPLSKFGIDYFGHMKLFDNGSFLHIMNNMDYQRDYLFKEGGFGNVFVDLYSSTENKKYFLMPYDQISIKKDRTIGIANYHNLFNCLNIYKNNNEYLSGYFFATKSRDTDILSFYVENILLLEHFIQYFNEKFADLIDVKDKDRLAKFDQHFNFTTMYQKEHVYDRKIKEFLQETQLEKIPLKTKYGDLFLSKRQNECLHYLSLGKSAKEIGRSLSLSPRTVEFYINNIKQKSGYHSKADLIREYSKNTLLL